VIGGETSDHRHPLDEREMVKVRFAPPVPSAFVTSLIEMIGVAFSRGGSGIGGPQIAETSEERSGLLRAAG
jgi:hypothetical protein